MNKLGFYFSFILLLTCSQSMASNYRCKISIVKNEILIDEVEKDVNLVYKVNFNVGLIHTHGSERYTLHEDTAFEPRRVYIKRQGPGMERVIAESDGNYVSLSDSNADIDCTSQDK